MEGKKEMEGKGSEGKKEGWRASHLFSSAQDIANYSWASSFLYSGGEDVRTKKVIKEDKKEKERRGRGGGRGDEERKRRKKGEPSTKQVGSLERGFLIILNK